MYIFHLMAYWYVFSKFYILGSLFVTHMLNVTYKKLWLTPLIINAIAVLLLIGGIAVKFIPPTSVFQSVLQIYLPIVFASLMMNGIIGVFHILRRKK